MLNWVDMHSLSSILYLDNRNLNSGDSTVYHQSFVLFQVCYGMIYGIGAKALGEQLEVDENEASVFIESFKNKYTGCSILYFLFIKSWEHTGIVQWVTYLSPTSQALGSFPG